jgi:hypothetical protein
MKLSIVYISYWKDLHWLAYSLQLLFKNLKGDFQVIVRVNADCEPVVREWGVPVRYVFLQRRWPDGYSYAMYEKMIADDYVDWDTDVIWLLDSDHMLRRPAHVEDFFIDGKPIVYYAEFKDLPEDYSRVAQAKWREPTERALGIPLDREYMISPPMAFWKDTFRNCRQRITRVNARAFCDTVYSDVPFEAAKFMDHPMTICDYETLGLYAAKFEPDRYSVIPVPLVSELPFKVYWSHGEFPQAELDALIHDQSLSPVLTP